MNRRFLLTLAVSFYIGAFYLYFSKDFLPTWDYLWTLIKGVPLEPQVELIPVCLFFSGFPMIWMPINLTRPSQLVYWYIYLLVYIPTVFSLTFALSTSYSYWLVANFIFMLGLFILQVPYYFKPITLSYRRFSYQNSWRLIWGIVATFMAYILFLYRDNLSLVNPFDSQAVYELRFFNSDNMVDPLVGYFILNLSGTILPLIFAFGLIKKKYKWVIIAVVVTVLLYMTAANKAFIFLIPMIMAHYFMLKKGGENFGVKIAVFYAILIIVVYNIYNLSSDEMKQITFAATSSILFRFVGINSHQPIWYIPFFENNPLTYYSHVRGIRSLIDYPYGESQLGQVIGFHYTGNARLNSNASFWLSDGIAAWGLPGVILISVIVSLLFWLSDSVTPSKATILVALTFSGLATNLMNASVFITFLSTGWLLLLVLLFFTDLFHTPAKNA